MPFNNCPRCSSSNIRLNGLIRDKQRLFCKSCSYNFTVDKLGKNYAPKYKIKAIQLYLEGLSYREIGRLLNINHGTIRNWIKAIKLEQIKPSRRPKAKLLTLEEFKLLTEDIVFFERYKVLISKIDDYFSLIYWEEKSL